MEESVDLMAAFLEQFIFVSEGSLVYDLNKPPHLALLKYEEFYKTHCNKRITYKNKSLVAPRQWLQHPTRITAHSQRYAPGKPRYFSVDPGVSYVNTYSPPGHEIWSESRFKSLGTELSDILRVPLDHIAYLFPAFEDGSWFLRWMAFSVQHPENRCKVTPLHISHYHGTGRGWLVKLLEKLLGEANCKKTTMSQLVNPLGFNDYLHESTLCTIEEVREGSRRFEVSDKIRDLLTEDRLEVNRKYGAKRTIQVFTNFLFFSNHIDAITIGAEDRRINVFKCPQRPRERSYYNELFSWIDQPINIEAFYNYLLRIDLKDFNWQVSLKSDARKSLINASYNLTERAFFYMLDHPPAKALTFKQCISYMKTFLYNEGFTDYQLGENQTLKLLQAHAKQYNSQVRIGSSVVRVWLLDDRWEPTPEKIRKELTRPNLAIPTGHPK